MDSECRFKEVLVMIYHGFKMKKELEAVINQKIVIDTRSSWVYIGILKEVTANCVILSEADVHDATDSATSKEVYIFDTRTTGIKPNRKTVHINLDYVVSFSLLGDVKKF